MSFSPSPLTIRDFVARHPGGVFTTLSRKVPFSVEIFEGALLITPHSTRRTRRITDAMIEKVCAEYALTRSSRPADYRDITFDSSYLVALIQAALEE